ncbi:MAG: hypothetical protein WBO23_13860 [Burkholderiales bacterium]
MKIHRLSFTLISVLVAALAGAVWLGSAPARAAFATMMSNISPTVKGTVFGRPESVAFSGIVPIESKMVTDPDFGGGPNIVLSINLSGVSGTGLSTRTKYATATQQVFIRPLAASDVVEFTFPFAPSGTSVTGVARDGLVTFKLTFDVATGRLTGAAGSIATPAP